MVVLEQIISIIHTFTYTKATIINSSFIHGGWSNVNTDFGYTRIAKHRFAKKKLHDSFLSRYFNCVLNEVMTLC